MTSGARIRGVSETLLPSIVAYATWREWDEAEFAYLECFQGFGPEDPLPQNNPPLVYVISIRPQRQG